MVDIQFDGDKSNIKDIVEFLNNGLANGWKVSELRKVLELGEKRLQKKLKENHYRYDSKSRCYSLTLDTEKKCTTDVVLQYDYNITTQMMNAITKMNDMSSKFEQMYNWYEMQTNDNVIDITRPELKIKPNSNITVTRSMRLYLDTYERFSAFCKVNKDKKVQDILESALVEFLDRYEERGYDESERST